MNTLKPCPFCGKIPKPDWTDESYIECTNRKCDIYSFGMSTGAWNTRPIEDALNARIAELEDWAYSNFETNNGKDSKPEPNVCEACGGDGSLLLTDGYKGQVVATAKCTYCNGTGRVNKECER